MFDDVSSMAKDMYKDMMSDAQMKMEKEKLGRVNFVLEEKLDDGRLLRANSFNPLLLLWAFDEFKQRAKNYPSSGKGSSDPTDNQERKQ